MVGRPYIKKLKERNFEGRVDLPWISEAWRYAKTWDRGTNQKFELRMEFEIIQNTGDGIKHHNFKLEAYTIYAMLYGGKY